MKNTISQKGRSMVEMMGYIAVSMAVIVGIGRIVSGIFNNHRYSTATLQLTELATSMVKSAAMEPSYETIIDDINTCLGSAGNVYNSDQCALTRSIIPASFRKAGTKLFHVFGGEVKIGKSPMKECDGENCECVYDDCKRVDQFSITYTGLSKKQCVEMAMRDWRYNQYTDLYAMQVNSAWWFWSAYGDDEGEAVDLSEGECDNNNSVCVLPAKRSVLTGVGDGKEQCKDDNVNTIRWVFN